MAIGFNQSQNIPYGSEGPQGLGGNLNTSFTPDVAAQATGANQTTSDRVDAGFANLADSQDSRVLNFEAIAGNERALEILSENMAKDFEPPEDITGLIEGAASAFKRQDLQGSQQRPQIVPTQGGRAPRQLGTVGQTAMNGPVGMGRQAAQFAKGRGLGFGG